MYIYYAIKLILPNLSALIYQFSRLNRLKSVIIYTIFKCFFELKKIYNWFFKSKND